MTLYYVILDNLVIYKLGEFENLTEAQERAARIYRDPRIVAPEEYVQGMVNDLLEDFGIVGVKPS